ncbi:MAG TPA: hypothetical protein VMF63_11495, partial [Opitutaceae bacterium]|nr:hypothetical protein [Opitutaceae bacterium]
MNADRRAPVLTWTAWWLAAGAVCTSGGWILSLAGWLRPIGYWVLVGVALMMAAIIARYTEFLRLPPWTGVRWRRYRRLWPAAFCLAAGLVVLGALAHEPNNVDAMTYRLPRVLHWLARGRWHWIETVDPRLNYSACGQEWLMAPWLALTDSGRLTWIWNFGGWLLLPGLLFLTLRDLGVRPRVAWVWMWLLPLAPLYVLQAGSVANDLLGAVYFVAALAFAARLRRDASKEALVFSIVAMALATGAKASNLPLVLPWLVLVAPIIWPNPGLRRAAWIMALPAGLVSVLPTLAANRVVTGGWTGDPARITGVETGGPWSGLVGNVTQFAAQNLVPPV